jgi:hypothetical protein
MGVCAQMLETAVGYITLLVAACIGTGASALVITHIFRRKDSV